MMKRFCAIWIALCFLATAGAVAEPVIEVKEDVRGSGIVIMRNREVSETEKQKKEIEYPTFESEDATLAAYLEEHVTEPFLDLCEIEQMAEDEAYLGGSKDFIRGSYFASMEVPGILSVEMTLASRAAGTKTQETAFLYRIIDLEAQKELTVYDLFNETPDAVDEAIRKAVYEAGQANADGTSTLESVETVPPADTYFVMKNGLRCIFDTGKIKKEAAFVDIPWERLALEQSSVLQEDNNELPKDEPIIVADDAQEEPIEGMESLLQSLMSSDWSYDNGTYYLRFGEDGVLTSPVSGSLAFEEYYIDDDTLVLVNLFAVEQRAEVMKQGNALVLTFEDGTDALTLYPAVIEQKQNAAVPLQAAPDAAFTLAPVQTPTPMPIKGDDVPAVDLLTRGLWKRMGTEENSYYQFTEDGKLLIVQVEEYTVKDGYLESDFLSGEIIMGGDTAFTLKKDDQQFGYVLNRSARSIPGEEFVTPAPTPEPTPTPAPTAEPTAEPTPEPTATPVPTPTLSPYEVAKQDAPSLAILGGESFENIKTLKVYSAPSEDAYRDERWQVTTDDKVDIYGVEGDWVLVGYLIGNGSKGRIGYIENSTLQTPEDVDRLGLVSIEATLTKSADVTDDPLNGKGKITSLKKGTEVKILGFLNSEWAYVEIIYNKKPCRMFIPQTSLMAE